MRGLTERCTPSSATSVVLTLFALLPVLVFSLVVLLPACGSRSMQLCWGADKADALECFALLLSEAVRMLYVARGSVVIAAVRW